MRRALAEARRSEPLGDRPDILEEEGTAIDDIAVVARQAEMEPGKRRHRAGAAEHLDAAAGDHRRDVVAPGELRHRRLRLADHRLVILAGDGIAAIALGEGDDAKRQRDDAQYLRLWRRIGGADAH